MRALMPLYVVVFVGFLGYSVMIAVFTPMMLRNDGGMLPASSSFAQRSLLLGLLLAVYPLRQFLGSPVLGTLSDRYGRRPILLASLAATTALYAAIAAALAIQSLPCLLRATLVSRGPAAAVVLEGLSPPGCGARPDPATPPGLEAR